MSLSGSKTRQKASETSQSTSSGTQTNTQSLDPWSKAQFESGSAGILGAIDGYNQNSPYKAYSGPLVAGLTPAETEARKLASTNVGAQNGILGNAENMISTAAGAGPSTVSAPNFGILSTVNKPSLGAANTFDAAQVGPLQQVGDRLGEIDKYMNPELSRVVDTTLASYDEDAARQRAAMQARAAANGAFGGSRYGVAQGVYDADTSRNRAGTEATLRSNAYNNATGLLSGDVNQVNQGILTQAQLNQQAAAANAGAKNQFQMQEGILGANADQFNAGAQNARDSERAGYDFAASGQNAQAQEAALARQMQGAGLLGNLAGQRAAIGESEVQMLRQFGLDERAIQQAQIDAEMAQYDKEAADRLMRLQLELQARSGILGQTPMLVNTTGTANQSNQGSGTSTGSSSTNGWGISAGFGPKGLAIGG